MLILWRGPAARTTLAASVCNCSVKGVFFFDFCSQLHSVHCLEYAWYDTPFYVSQKLQDDNWSNAMCTQDGVRYRIGQAEAWWQQREELAIEHPGVPELEIPKSDEETLYAATA